MTQPTLPKLPIPGPIRGLEENTWAHYSVSVRLPDIGRRTLLENEFPSPVRERFEALIGEVPQGRIRALDMPAAPDAAEWQRYAAAHAGLTWLEAPWFFAEHYFYARILEASGYYANGPTRGRDPFALQKRLGLETSRAAIEDLCAHASALGRRPERAREFAAELLAVDLWANQVDLSLWPAGEGEESDFRPLEARHDHVLVDDAAAVAAHLAGLPRDAARVDFILDNAGFELVCDLCLVDFLLASGLAAEVRLHLKPAPSFVSDALIGDVRATLEFLRASGGHAAEVATRLSAARERGSLRLADDYFWVSPLAAWEMPAALRDELSGAALVISKGDANYRRLLGDRHWPFGARFGDILAYFPAPLLALRTIKAELAVGLEPDIPGRIARLDPDWLTNGQWGLIQFRP